MVVQLTQDTYEQEVMKAEGTVLVDFYADWCGPCKMMGPVVEKLADEYDKVAKVGKVNIDDEELLAAKYGVMSIPCFVIIKDGKVIDQALGAMPKEALEEKLKKAL